MEAENTNEESLDETSESLESPVEQAEENSDIDSILHKKSKKSWARLIAKIYEIDPMVCPKCNSEMVITAIITSEYEIIIIPTSIRRGKRYCDIC